MFFGNKEKRMKWDADDTDCQGKTRMKTDFLLFLISNMLIKHFLSIKNLIEKFSTQIRQIFADNNLGICVIKSNDFKFTSSVRYRSGVLICEICGLFPS